MIDTHNRQRTHSSIQHINAPFEIQTNFTFPNHTLFSEGRTNGLLTLCCKTFKQFSFKIYIVFFCWIMSKSLVFHLLQIMCCDAAEHRKPQCIEVADIDVYLEKQIGQWIQRIQMKSLPSRLFAVFLVKISIFVFHSGNYFYFIPIAIQWLV